MPRPPSNPSSAARPLRGRAAVPLLLAGLAFLFLFPYLVLGRAMLPLELVPVFHPWQKHSDALWGAVPPVWNPLLDSLQQYFPRRVFMREALAGGWLPLWNTGVYGGTPFLAAQQGAVLYPPAWLLALLPAELQFGWSAWLHLSLAAIGGWLFFRQLGLGAAGAAAGALAFTLNGFAVVWLSYPNVAQWTLAWLPLALWCWERGRAGDDLRWQAACGGALALNLLGGHGQSSAYVLLAWAAWALVRLPGSPRPLRSALRWLAFPSALAVGLSLGHLLPVLEYVPRTDRGERIPWDAVVRAGMPLSQLWTFLLPRLFGDETLAFAHRSWLPLDGKAGLAFVERSFYPGAAVLALAAGAWASRRGRDAPRLAAYGLGLTAAAVLLAMGTPLYWPLWRFLPGFGSFTAVARILCLAGWGLACLAALGVEALGSEEPEARGRAFRPVAAAGIAGALAAVVGHFIYGGAAPADVTRSLAAMGRPSADSLALRDFLLALLGLLLPVLLAGLAAAGRLRPGRAAALAAAVVGADLCAFGFGFNPAAETRFLYRDTPELAALRADPEPARVLSAGPPGREAALQRRMPSNLPSTLGMADIGGSDSFVPLRYRDWLDATRQAAGGDSPWSRFGSPNLRAAAVRYYLTGAEVVSPGLEAAAGPGLQRDRRALPFARLHGHVRALPGEPELWQALAQPDRAPAVALTSGTGAPAFHGPPTVTPFRVTRPNGNRLRMEGEAPGDGLLVVAEGYDPGWRVRIDGGPAGRPVPADGFMTGIPLPAGPHRVDMEYRPASFRVGLFGTLAALAAACAVAAAGVRGRRPRTEE